MTQRQSKGRGKDKKKIKKGGNAADNLLTTQGAEQDRSEYYKACLESIDSIRPLFEHRALRRTLQSKTPDKSLWSLSDPIIVTLALKLHPHEYDVLERSAQFARENAKKDPTWRTVSIPVIYMPFGANLV